VTRSGDAILSTSVLLPSATISPGYGAVTVETKAGAIILGVLKQATAAGLQIMGVDGKLVSIAKDDIKEQQGMSISLMPEGLQASLSLKEFTDLVEYLTSLQQPESTLVSNHGMPSVIPPLAKPVNVRPFFRDEFKLPRTKAETGLSSLRQVPGSSNVFLVLHQKGMIWKVEKTRNGRRETVFADLTNEVFSDRGPNGLLDVAFHPKFRENPEVLLVLPGVRGWHSRHSHRGERVRSLTSAETPASKRACF
jgi:putative heme-binding domain-containing protein